MSIIHDALKKTQQGLSPKVNDLPSPIASGSTSKGAAYIYATPSYPEIKPDSTGKKSTLNKIKSIFIFICTTIITVGAGWYIYQQIKHELPRPKIEYPESFHQSFHPAAVSNLKTIIASEVSKLPLPTTIKAEVIAPAANTTSVAAPVRMLIPAPVPAPAAPTTAPLAAPVAAPPPPAATLKVQGIMTDSKGNLALINDQVYQEGDEINGTKILKINLNSVTVKHNGVKEKISVKN